MPAKPMIEEPSPTNPGIDELEMALWDALDTLERT